MTGCIEKGDDCSKSGRLRRGRCNTHYRRFIKACSDRVQLANGKAKEFLEWAIAQETDECIDWPTPIKSRYPQFMGSTAGRYVLTKTVGEPEEGLHACHKPEICHNTKCVNKRHLYWGTPEENERDKIIDQTVARGESGGNTKITEDQAIEIFHDPRTYKEIANDHELHYSTVGLIKQGKLWGWLTGKAA